MTIDEAIKHAKENAEKKFAEGMLCHANPNDDFLDKCIDCAREHLQLAEWLEELKAIRQWKADVMEDFCRYDVNCFEELISNTRKKTIDEFAEKAKTQLEDMYCEAWNRDIDEIAEQLKEGDSYGT